MNKPAHPAAAAPPGNPPSAIHAGEVTGRVPGQGINVEQLEEKARRRLAPDAYGYVAGGAGAEEARRANREAFRRWLIVPRPPRHPAARDLAVGVLGTRMAAPVLLAPIGVQSIVHPDAELAVARAAASVGIPLVAATAASLPLEAVATAMGAAPRWFQLYWPGDRELAKSFLARAGRAGYGAIVVTLDAWQPGGRPGDLRRSCLPFLRGEGLGNYFADPVFRAALARPPEEDPRAAAEHFRKVISDATVTWDDLSFLRQHTSLPLLLKGILRPDDAAEAVGLGMDGIIVSNHGGRQVDGASGALDALPGVVAAVDGRLPVLFDSGIRHGADAFKALALGARAVLLGRPYLWGLAVDGEEGVRRVLRGLLAELDLTLALAGLTRPAQLSPDALERI